MYCKWFFSFYCVLYFVVFPLFFQFFNVYFYFFPNSQPQHVLQMFLILALKWGSVSYKLSSYKKKKECNKRVEKVNLFTGFFDTLCPPSPAKLSSTPKKNFTHLFAVFNSRFICKKSKLLRHRSTSGGMIYDT